MNKNDKILTIMNNTIFIQKITLVIQISALIFLLLLNFI